MEIEQTFDLTKRILVNMASSQIWGLHPEKGWSRPLVIEYNGEWYMLANLNEEKYFEEKYFDYSDDVKNGDYVPTGIKVEDRLIIMSNEGCIPSRDYKEKHFKILYDDNKRKGNETP